VRWTRRRLIALALVGVAVAAPGWRATLYPVSHEELLAAARAAAAVRVFGISLADGPNSERWHAQFVGRALPVVLHDLGVRGALPSLVPPDYAAHIPAGAERADGYYEVVAETHWPWWRPGGGVEWRTSD